ncbi:MAG: Co2+/Mg2+ efflux protein ApaG [Gammaproteobacteria bacterium]|nr:Co2+/Mg2+ efflux protein ApaG [Gammaproteobacteria bacterium]
MTQEPNKISVHVETSYIESQSIPEQNRYVFSYTITIKNTGAVGARLLNRHWIITDANGQVQEVTGEGVVGKKPYIRPGEDFSYTSGTALETPLGSMHGSYQMRSETGDHFDATIAPFTLAIPKSLH